MRHEAIALNNMVQSKTVGATTKAKSLIQGNIEACQYELTHRLTLLGGFGGGNCPWLISLANSAAYLLNLKHEFFCLANISLWYDPFSPTLHDRIASMHYKHEEFPEHKLVGNFAELLHQVNNHSKVFQRYPFLPKKYLKIRNGVDTERMLMARLGLCLEDDGAHNNRSSMWYNGVIHDQDIIQMLHRHLGSSPPPLYDSA